MNSIRQVLLFFGCVCALLGGVQPSALAQNGDRGFVVQTIEVDGLRRIKKKTVLSYLPVHVGQTFHPDQSGDVIHKLYATGFFENVRVARRGNALVILVVERATIGHVSVVGNKSITKKELLKGLRDNGLSEGSPFKRSTLTGMEKALRDQYALRGRYDATVVGKVSEQSRNRVAITLAIHEGRTAKIKSIHFEGNEHFSDHKLRSKMLLTTGGLWTFITSSNHYSEPQLDADLKRVANFYMNHGYLNFKVVDKSVDIQRKGKKTDVHITITVKEGERYRFTGYDITGELVLSKEALHKNIRDHVDLRPGTLFSKQTVVAGQKALATALGDVGFAFATINVMPQVDEQKHEVFITYRIVPGHRVYIRRILFEGNRITSDWVLRREMRQMEGALSSISQIKSSERHLRLLQYIKEANARTQPVPGASDQVDLIFKTVETAANKATFTLGYGTDGVVLGAELTQNNFLGSGSTVSLTGSKDDYQKIFSATYYNPYYTQNGVGRGFHLYIQKTTPDDSNVSAYSTDVYGINMFFNIPVGEDEKINVGLGFESTKLDISPAGLSTSSTQAIAFRAANGNQFRQILATTGWSQDRRNRAIFPTKGIQQNLSFQVALPAGSQALDYYIAQYTIKAYMPVFKGFVLTGSSRLGFGDGFGSTSALPFFRNFYAGGVESIRGFENNTLGPRDSNNDPYGGNLLVSGSIGIILPPFNDKLRATLFVDAGNVFLTKKVPGLFNPETGAVIPGPSGGVHFSDIRASVGLGIEWRTPFAPLAVSVAAPLNKKRGDRTEYFQFNIGGSF